MVGFHVPDGDQIDVDPTELLRDFDAERFVQAIADSGAQQFLFYASPNTVHLSTTMCLTMSKRVVHDSDFGHIR